MCSADDIISLAVGEIGTTENPPGTNNVKYNTAYYGKPVSSPGGAAYAWCCAFVWWLFRQAGAEDLFYGGQKTAYCPTLVQWFKQQGQWVTHDYQPGDIVFFNFSGGTGAKHVGIVEKALSGKLSTIEGNTGAGNDTNGGAVMRRMREIKHVLGAGRPAYGEADDMTKDEVLAIIKEYEAEKVNAAPAEWSEDARSWAESNGIIFGDGQGRMQYKASCTREQMIVFLYRALQPLQAAVVSLDAKIQKLL